MPFKPATIRLLASLSWLMILGLFAMSSPLQAADPRSAVSPATQSVPAPHRCIGSVTILTDTQGVNYSLAHLPSQAITPEEDKAAGFCRNVQQGDFLECFGLGKFPRIVMNPPFAKTAMISSTSLTRSAAPKKG